MNVRDFRYKLFKGSRDEEYVESRTDLENDCDDSDDDDDEEDEEA